MINKESIQGLLDSYMAAETTREEEKLLSDYFSSHKEIPAEWQSFSVMFRGFRQVEAKSTTTTKRAILKWCAVAASIVFIYGTGLLFLHKHKEKPTEDPSKRMTSLPVKQSQQVIEQQIEPIIEVPVQPKPISQACTRKPRIRKSFVQKISTEEDDTKAKENNRPSLGIGTSNLSIHRDRMRQNIQAAFENSSDFTSQPPVEL